MSATVSASLRRLPADEHARELGELLSRFATRREVVEQAGVPLRITAMARELETLAMGLPGADG